MSKDEILKKIQQNSEKVKQYQVKRIGLFGSYAKGQENPKSDMDFIVEFSKKSFDNYMDLKFFLESLFNVKVDLVISDAVKPQLKPLISKETVYVQGL